MCASANSLDTDGGALAAGVGLLLVVIVRDISTVVRLLGRALGGGSRTSRRVSTSDGSSSGGGTL